MLFFCCSSGFPWVTDTDAAEFLIVTIFQNHGLFVAVTALRVLA